jgi:predicted dehydrogenase
MDGATKLALQTKAGWESLTFEPQDMLVEELDEFARCMRNEAIPETGAKEALAALEVIRGAIDSHEQGRVISMQELKDAADC